MGQAAMKYLFDRDSQWAHLHFDIPNGKGSNSRLVSREAIEEFKTQCHRTNVYQLYTSHVTALGAYRHIMSRPLFEHLLTLAPFPESQHKSLRLLFTLFEMRCGKWVNGACVGIDFRLYCAALCAFTSGPLSDRLRCTECLVHV